MTKLDDSINNIDYIYACLMDYRLILASGSCNDCSKKKNCEYVPKPGHLVRFNCPFYEREEENDEI